VLIQVLCVPECRNCQPAVDRVRQVLRSEGVDARVEEVLVVEEAAARSVHFPGSPTVRVDGVDVEPSGQGVFGLACRLYADGSGLPSEQALRRAISAAREQR
jgi:thioredoxin family protein